MFKTKINIFTPFLLIIFLSGCSSLVMQDNTSANSQNGWDISYSKGVRVATNSQKDTDIKLEIVDQKLGSSSSYPLLIKVSAKLKQNSFKSIDFSLKDILLKIGSTSMHPLSLKELEYFNFDLSSLLDLYGANYDSNKNQDDLSSLSFNKYAYFYPYPYGYGNFYFPYYRYYMYPYPFYAFPRGRINIKENKAKMYLEKHYLRKNTLTSNYKGGFILVPYNRLEKGILYIEVALGEDKFIYSLVLE